MNIIEKIIREVINEEEVAKPTNKELVTRMFNLLVEGAEDNFKGFKEFVNDSSCLCRISVYVEVINKLTPDELNEVVKETGITKDILNNFREIIQDRYDEIVATVRNELGLLEIKIMGIDFDDKPDFDKMSKEELIKYIKNTNK